MRLCRAFSESGQNRMPFAGRSEGNGIPTAKRRWAGVSGRSLDDVLALFSTVQRVPGTGSVPGQRAGRPDRGQCLGAARRAPMVLSGTARRACVPRSPADGGTATATSAASAGNARSSAACLVERRGCIEGRQAGPAHSSGPPSHYTPTSGRGRRRSLCRCPARAIRPASPISTRPGAASRSCHHPGNRSRSPQPCAGTLCPPHRQAWLIAARLYDYGGVIGPGRFTQLNWRWRSRKAALFTERVGAPGPPRPAGHKGVEGCAPAAPHRAERVPDRAVGTPPST